MSQETGLGRWGRTLPKEGHTLVIVRCPEERPREKRRKEKKTGREKK